MRAEGPKPPPSPPKSRAIGIYPTSLCPSRSISSAFIGCELGTRKTNHIAVGHFPPSAPLPRYTDEPLPSLSYPSLLLLYSVYSLFSR